MTLIPGKRSLPGNIMHRSICNGCVSIICVCNNPIDKLCIWMFSSVKGRNGFMAGEGGGEGKWRVESISLSQRKLPTERGFFSRDSGPRLKPGCARYTTAQC